MPITAELHDGRQLEFPDGTDPSIVQATVKKMLGQQQPVSSTLPAQPLGNAGVGLNAANKAIAGTIDAFGNAPANVWNLLKAGVGTAATALGHKELAPDLTESPDIARKAMTYLGAIKPEYEPQTTGQRLLDAGVQGGTSMLMNPANSMRQATVNALTGAVSQVGAQGVTELTGSPEAGMAASLIAPSLAAKGGELARNRITAAQLRQSQNVPKDQALAHGQEAGYVVPPSQASPTIVNKTIESIGGKAAVQQDASLRNAQVTDDLARQALNVPAETPLTPEVTKAVRNQAFQQGYVPVQNAGTISTGRAYRTELDAIEAPYQRAASSFPDAARTDIMGLVQGLRQRTFDAGAAVSRIQTLREDGSKAFASGDNALGRANIQAANALENQIERGLPQGSQLLDNFRVARQQMAIAHTVEDAIKVGTGSVDAKKLAGALQKGEPLSGPLKVAAEFAQNYPKAVQTASTVGSPGVSKVVATVAALMGTGGAHVAGPMAAAAGAAIPFVAPPMARSMILSDRFQRGLQPTYDTSLVNRAMAQVPEAGPGQFFSPLQFAEELRRQQVKGK